MSKEKEIGAAPAVPEGWKLMPIESTPEMDEAGWLSMCTESAQKVDAERCWDAMAAAAPAAPAQQDNSAPKDMWQACEWITQLRARVDSLLEIINAAPAVTVSPAPRVDDGELPISRSTYGSLEECEREHARRADLARQAQPTDRDAVPTDADRWQFMMKIADSEEGPEAQALESFDSAFEDGSPKSAQLVSMVDSAIRALKGKSGSEGAAE